MQSAKQEAEAMIHALPKDADAGRMIPHDGIKAQPAPWRAA